MTMLKPTRRGLLTGAAALAAYAALPREAARALRGDYEPPANPFTIYGSSLSAMWSAEEYRLMTDDGAGLISNWKDRVSGLAVTATTTARATWGAASFNSAYPGLTFDGSANCYVATSFAALPTGATAGEIWAVGTAVSSANAGYCAAYGTSGAATDRSVRHGTASDTAVISDGSTASTGPASSPLTSPFILCGQWSGTAMTGFVNGNAFAGNPATIATLNTGTTRLRIGALNGTSAASFFQGVLALVAVTSVVSSTAQRQKMEGFLAWKYGLQTAAGSFLPSGHPYAFGRPPA
jgi:hypothetical protein